MRVWFWCENTRDGKNVCDTVVAHFLLFPPGELPRAFHTKARSHFPITALSCRYLKSYLFAKPGPVLLFNPFERPVQTHRRNPLRPKADAQRLSSAANKGSLLERMVRRHLTGPFFLFTLFAMAVSFLPLASYISVKTCSTRL